MSRLRSQRRVARSLFAAVVLVALPLAPTGVATADGVPPVTAQLREQEAGRFLAQWRVPQVLPMAAIPSPRLPESCRAVGERTLTERPGAWFLHQVYECPEGLSGQSVGIDYPMLNAMVTTILRVELLSGERYAHSFAPAEGPWRIPDAAATDARALYREIGDATLAGVLHFARGGLHWGFVTVALLAAPGLQAARMGGAFALAQVLGLLIMRLFGSALPAGLAEIGLATAVVLLAREALRPAEERRQLLALAACAGLVHGLGLPALIPPPAESLGPPRLFSFLTVVGMDGVLLACLAIATLLRSLIGRALSAPLRTGLAYVAGTGAVALALVAPALGSAPGPDRGAALRLPDLPIPTGGGVAPASTRLATQLPDAPLQSFLTVAPFEVRHEVLVRLGEMTEELGVDGDATVEIDELGGLEQGLRAWLSDRHVVEIDGARVEPRLVRVDFLTVDDRGALPRPEPVAEVVAEAWMGLTSVYLTTRTPSALTLTWSGLDQDASLPATVTDPESTRTEELTARQPTLHWTNELSEDPTPVVTELAIEPPVAWTPTVSLVVTALAVFAAIALRRRRFSIGPTLRGALTVACLLAPVGVVALPLPGSWRTAPSADEAQRILTGLLPNVYRAFEFPTESAVYDRLALAVTGDTLGEIYLEHRRAVELEERGGARARVEAVEVQEVGEVRTIEPDGFVADAVWTVGGTVTHFGHRHYRRNRYDARVSVVPTEGVWKIHGIEVFDEGRLQ